MWQRNAIVLLVAAAVVVALTALAHATEHVYKNLNSDQRLGVALSIFACISVATFVSLRGGFWTRTALVLLVPASLSLIGEAMNRDAAYPGIGIVLGAILVTVSFLACVLIGGPIFLWRQHKRGAT